MWEIWGGNIKSERRDKYKGRLSELIQEISAPSPFQTISRIIG